MADMPQLKDLPLVLAGPILRRTELRETKQPNGEITTAGQVTVWVALKKPKAVTLRVYGPRPFAATLPLPPPILIGTRKTIALGAHLHLVAVTARVPDGGLFDLEHGKEYFYNLALGDTVAGEQHIDEAADNTLLSDEVLFTKAEREAASGSAGPQQEALLRLSYADEPLPLPSFAMAPMDITNLRLIHASCRKPHGEGVDQLAKLDELIDPVKRGVAERPHLLFLTGDQIYADDVAEQLLNLIMHWSKELLVGPGPDASHWSHEEEICLKWKDGSVSESEAEQYKRINKDTEEFKAGGRASVMRDHGFTVNEEFAGSHLVGLGEFYVMYLLTWSDKLWPKTLINDKQRADLENFRTALPRVRRALANLPTYMMLDDHEITDDWYLHLEWCVHVLGNPFGKRVIQNGLAAYALFQGWGNTPDQFDPAVASATEPGPLFLEAMQNWRGDLNDSSEKTIARHLGIFHRGGPQSADPTKPGLRLGDLICRRGLDHPPGLGVLDWHYQVEGPGFQVLVMDTRTWRHFPSKSSKNADFSVAQRDILDARDFSKLDDPTEPPALISSEGRLAQIPEIPEIPESEIEYLFVVSPCPVYGIEWVDYAKWAKKVFFRSQAGADFEDWGLQTDARTEFLFALGNYISSLRKEPNTEIPCAFLTGDIHFGYCCTIKLSHTLLPISQKFINLTASSLKNETKEWKGTLKTQSIGVEFWWDRDPPPEPDIDTVTGATTTTEYVLDIGCVGNTPPCIPKFICPPHTTTSQAEALKVGQCVIKAHQTTKKLRQGREVVGRNNLGEVNIATGDTSRRLTQTLYWYDSDKPEFPRKTRFIVTL